jgi:flagellar hook-length control protein FliK
LTDLPIPSKSIDPVGRPAPGAALRETPIADLLAPAGTGSFQEALEQELGLGPDSSTASRRRTLATATKADAAPDSGDDPLQAAATVDPALAFAFIGAPIVPPPAGATLISPPTIAVDSELPQTAGDASPLTPTFADASQLSPAIGSASVPPPTSIPGGAERAAPTIERASDPLRRPATVASDEKQQNPTLRPPAAPDATDFAVPGNLPPAAKGDGQREISRDPGLPEQFRAAPMAPIAVHVEPARDQLAVASPAPLNVPVGQRGWDQGLGDRMVWMAGQGHQVAELHLNPPDLGPMTIALTLDNDQASARFTSPHAAVRDAIETAMPRLREMLADSGITLGNASVGADNLRQQPQQEPKQEPRAHAARFDAVAADSVVMSGGTPLLRLARGAVDTYA